MIISINASICYIISLRHPMTPGELTSYRSQTMSTLHTESVTSCRSPYDNMEPDSDDNDMRYLQEG